MSAWYIFSAMGFYPVDPVSGEYELGVPLFPEITLHLPGGKTFTVLCHSERSEESQNEHNAKALCHSERSEESQKKHTQETARDSSVATFLRNDTARYRKAYLNGKRVEGTTITHRDIISGGVLEFR